MEEIWKDVVGYEGLYQVSNLGRVKSLTRKNVKQDRLLTPTNNNGYYCVSLLKNKKRKFCLIHRLVAKTFVENPDNKKEVNHIDGNKKNNRANNLEWCTPSENIIHAYKEKLKKPVCLNKQIKQLDMEGNLIKIWSSVKEAGEHFNTSPTNITKCLTGKQKTAKGYKWLFVEKKIKNENIFVI